MRSLHFVLGGARSGKSRHAETLIEAAPAPWHYIATAQAFDDEMRERIAIHRARRKGAGAWQTHDAPLDLPGVLQTLPARETVLVDCLTLWLSNLMLNDQELKPAAERLLAALAAREGTTVLVSNEVGFGIVPETPLGRRFRDEAGFLNQKVAAAADSVTLVVAGLPMKVK
ncbi:bifunctional adenosylcobinamide kinase/adenosylcobinamide-phosphate guanylyltransferase [Nitratireductor aquimarinus]|uniref:bifunctional adenosylcobinamide kinase/adenosylcobinamide-phosphate guanylyltransferase n=1 Tax=Alphaproteobacteria TaxID=28211 RepID=UPI0019D383C6|nr:MULTISPECIES: bifunctional adenosylcobinamide kinase/adenosylcobinamide-phosphate guanylyltransferase [Alphaproteobacteria]MBN7758892.1 bifunctional adenosylcobinamide kinase/adenosylcobinamide-phosphate guanylyltransferase [Nitratireductor aquimarinus]MBY6001893.1 bifunctional adenosylcobinamide kinase/adenosylcobinamide-phosphate guanylyltransferase [Tritonibacter mobilis]MBY6024178.1 bifunctional adenosylcobinamide kinase/adenosylcobinamide-phosphate guanylyltransferase [Nitratireductor sp